MSKVGPCPRCDAPQGMIGWLCGHNGDSEHDRDEDMFWEDCYRIRDKIGREILRKLD